MLGAEAALWGVALDPAVVDAVAWPRAAVLGERLWAPNGSFTPGDYGEVLPRLQVHRCRLLALGVGGWVMNIALRNNETYRKFTGVMNVGNMISGAMERN